MSRYAKETWARRDKYVRLLISVGISLFRFESLTLIRAYILFVESLIVGFFI